MSQPNHPICPVCDRRFLDLTHERRRGLCDDCAQRTGLWLEPPELRPSRPCQRCGNHEFVCSQLRERGGRAGDAHVVPLGVSMAPVATGDAAPWTPMGILIAFACRACGLTELYTLEADKLPIGPEHGTHLVECAPLGGPMR